VQISIPPLPYKNCISLEASDCYELPLNTQFTQNFTRITTKLKLQLMLSNVDTNHYSELNHEFCLDRPQLHPLLSLAAVTPGHMKSSTDRPATSAEITLRTATEPGLQQCRYSSTILPPASQVA
jgi:hypothetical protein